MPNKQKADEISDAERAHDEAPKAKLDGGVRDEAAEARAAAIRDAGPKWLYYGTDGYGNHYDLDEGNKKNRRVRAGGQGDPIQKGWLDGGDWDVKADEAVAPKAPA
ncbi:MAG: hypothetical protein K0R61_2371 [Microvirga sp.]|jgi:hypothetical protein|nr:hypothetical protein [Microvirga sp.]MDF2971921.1 hypothetical protein [Microvirga sp.]